MLWEDVTGAPPRPWTVDALENSMNSVCSSTLERKDGRPMDEEDDATLMEWGAFMFVFRGLESLMTPLDASNTLARKDGQPVDEDDEAVLLEWGPCLSVLQALEPIWSLATLDLPPVHMFGLWAEPDESMIAVSKKLAETYSYGEMDDDFDVACTPYSAWAAVGKLTFQMYDKMVGSLEDIHSMTSLKSSAASNKMKRTPSGGELNATLGLGVQSALGLSNPKRKVKVRNIL